MSELSLTNVISISVSAAPMGLGEFNTSNLALFSHEPHNASFGADLYKAYLSAKEVEEDFGTESVTYKMALRVFAQQLNIRAGGGQLIVIPYQVSKQTVSFSEVPTTGSFVLEHGGAASAAILVADSAAQIETKLRAIPGLEKCRVSGSVATGLVVALEGIYGPSAALVASSVSLTDGTDPVTVTVAESQAGETIVQALARTIESVQYFGAISTRIHSEAEVLASAAAIQAESKIAGFVSDNPATLEADGMLDKLRSSGFTKTRGLYHGSQPLEFLAAYFSKALSTNFRGSKTTKTMHLKDLASVAPDTTINQTLLNKAKAAGVDVLASFNGVSKVFTSGKNRFFDQVYHELWLTNALQIAGFNYLATISTKIPQTEDGMLGLKSALDTVAEQARRNGYCAAGKWTQADYFGDQEDFMSNIEQVGFYTYSSPIAEQQAAERASREAPLTQIAVKEAGALHGAGVLVNVNP
jgi:hypothetical protein